MATTPPSGQSCSTCKFCISRAYGPNVTVGECRYSPPVTQGQQGVWPQVLDTDWCGDWAAIGTREANNERS